MAASLPVPITFTLPEGWQQAPPDLAGAPGVAFIARHPGSSNGFTANITISGEFRPDNAALVTIADESVVRLEQGASVQLEERNELGAEEAPGLTQQLRMSTTIDEQQLELIQSQVYLVIQDTEDQRRRAIIMLTLTATPAQFGEVVGHFQQFLRTVRLAEEESG